MKIIISIITIIITSKGILIINLQINLGLYILGFSFPYPNNNIPLLQFYTTTLPSSKVYFSIFIPDILFQSASENVPYIRSCETAML